MKRTLRVAVYGTAGAYAVLTLVDSDRRKHLRGTVDGFQRFGRTLYAGLLASYDYKFVLGAGERTHGRGSDEYKALKKVVDKRNAERMLAVCKKSGGLSTHTRANASLPRIPAPDIIRPPPPAPPPTRPHTFRRLLQQVRPVRVHPELRPAPRVDGDAL